ncbi:NTP transferase domain-containing protein [Streptomyces longispororuber]|uniref:NTP transferase domain-containing protein n=1 Tax=Streptomyces longispororuber TaxID=68230 RepID=UPI0036F73C00
MTSNSARGAAAFDAVVLAGGRAARLGGADKPGVRVGGRALLDRVLAACADAGTTVVVAAPRPTSRPVVWAREQPAGGGPLAALDAGLRRTAADLVVVLSADLPFLREETVRRLVGAVGTADGALLTDPEGRDQPLVAAYRRAALRRELDRLAAGGGEEPTQGEFEPVVERRGLAGLPLRLLTGALELVRVPEALAAFDCDTWDDIAAARARIREHGHVLDEWISAVKDELGIDLDVDTGALLDLARDAAHGVARPAAPLTTFLVGYAAGRVGTAGGGPQAVAEAARKAAVLAARWEQETASGGTPSTAAAPDSGAPSGGAPSAAAPSGGAPSGEAPAAQGEGAAARPASGPAAAPDDSSPSAPETS